MAYLNFENMRDWKKTIPQKRATSSRLFLHKVEEEGRQKAAVVFLPHMISQIQYCCGDIPDEDLLRYHNKIKPEHISKAVNYFASEDMPMLFSESTLRTTYPVSMYFSSSAPLEGFNTTRYGLNLDYSTERDVVWPLAFAKYTHHKLNSTNVENKDFVITVPKVLYLDVSGVFGHRKETLAKLATFKYAIELPELPVNTHYAYATINKCLVSFHKGLVTWLEDVSFQDFKDLFTYVYLIGAFTAYKETDEYKRSI